MPVYQLPREPLFPHPDEAESDGLLAIGGDLSPRRLVAAYASGIFPWYNDGDPILWWSPNPRMVLWPSKFKTSKSLLQQINRKTFDIRVDFAFDEVISRCKAVTRPGQNGTWITDEVLDAYINMHKMGLAHSVEAWQGNKLVGGLYGLSIGTMFYGESMFHLRTGASKVAFYYLAKIAIKLNIELIDCQVPNPHLFSLGAEELERAKFLDIIANAIEQPTIQGNWGKLPQLQNI